jgi:hypothetical protein
MRLRSDTDANHAPFRKVLERNERANGEALSIDTESRKFRNFDSFRKQP